MYATVTENTNRPIICELESVSLQDSTMNYSVVGLLAFVFLASTSPIDDVAENYVIGGRAARTGQFPSIVSIRTNTNLHICAGNIMSDRWVVTSGSCAFFVNNRKDMYINVGTHQRNGGKKIRIARAITHPRYENIAFSYDIAVIQTRERIVFNNNVQPLRWPRSGNLPVGQTGRMVGWGWDRVSRIYMLVFPYLLISFTTFIHSFIKNPNPPNREVDLKWKDALIISANQCRQLQPPRQKAMVHEHSFCTRSPRGQGTCAHDQGGPLMARDGSVIGIISLGTGCGNRPDIYFNLWHGIKFIRQATQNQIPNMPQGSR